MSDELYAAIKSARDHLALMLPNPVEYGADQWPVSNPGDAEALRAAYDVLETALFDYEPSTRQPLSVDAERE